MSQLAVEFQEKAENRLSEVRTSRQEVEAKVQKIQAEELQPLVTEEQEIEQELARLKGQALNGSVPRGASAPGGTTVRRGRPPAGEPSRKDQVLDLIRAGGSEGVTIKEMQTQLGMANPNYLYRVTSKDLSGQITKKDNGRFVIS